MTYPDVQLVTAPADDATVLFDLNEESPPGGEAIRRVLAEEFTLGAPTLEGDADAIDPLYGPRTITVPLEVKGTKSQALACLSSLARVVFTGYTGGFIPGLWLRVQVTPYHLPVWFRLMRPLPGDLSWENVYVHPDDDEEVRTDRWELSLELDAHPFGYGARVTESLVVVNNNPASGTNPCFALVTDVAGDAVTPARIRATYSAAQTGRRHMLACSPVSTDYTAPIVWPVGGTDGWTLGDDVGSSTSDADYSGGSYRAVSFATETDLVNRLSGAAPFAIPPGKYKVLARVARSDTASQFTVRFGVTTGFEYVYGDTVALSWNTSAVEHAAYVDLGEFRFPQGNQLPDLSGEPDVTPVVAFQAARTSGAGSLHIDTFMLVPMTDRNARVLFVNYVSLAPSALLTREYHDGNLGIIYARNPSTGVLSSMAAPEVKGGYPLLTPGQPNALHFVEQTSTTRAQTTGGTDTPDRITSQVTLEVSYFPLYLNIPEA